MDIVKALTEAARKEHQANLLEGEAKKAKYEVMEFLVLRMVKKFKKNELAVMFEDDRMAQHNLMDRFRDEFGITNDSLRYERERTNPKVHQTMRTRLMWLFKQCAQSAFEIKRQGIKIPKKGGGNFLLSLGAGGRSFAKKA